MAQTIVPGPFGDTPKVVEDKVRALPSNQGLNDNAMWLLIDNEITAAATAGKLIANVLYTVPTASVSSNKHGNK